MHFAQTNKCFNNKQMLQEQMPSQLLVVTLQHIALWENSMQGGLVDAFWGFPLHQYASQEFFSIL